MKKYSCLTFAKHKGCDKAFLFCIDSIVNIKDGTELLVDTKKGQKEAVSVGGSFLADDRAVNAIATVAGATFPLKKVLGIIERKTEIHRIDAQQTLG